jgi:hypothetical protein
MMFWLILICPGLLAAYFVFLRPVLKAIPALSKFYAEADSFRAKISALGWHSTTIAWSYFMALVGFVMDWIEPIATALGDPDIKTQMTNTLQADPQILAYFLMVVSAVTIAARLRSIAKG